MSQQRFSYRLLIAFLSVLSLGWIWFFSFGPQRPKLIQSAYTNYLSATECRASVLSLAPASGPKGTIVRLVGAGFTGISEVLVDGYKADSFYVLRSNLCLVRIPEQATEGAISLITSCDTAVTEAFNVLPSECRPETTYRNLFFSEYGEGESKYLELYNASSDTLDLGEYRIRVAYNGLTNFNTNLALSGTLAPGAVYVVADNSSSAAVLAKADLTVGNLNFNGDDFVALFYQSGLIDAIGELGEDPGSGWSVGEKERSTSGQTLIRKAYISQGEPDWRIASGANRPYELAQWEVSVLTADSLGWHQSRTQNLFFSEYAEGEGYDKYLEIFNPLADTVDLSEYELVFAFNGEAISQSLPLSGTLAPYGVHVIAHSSATDSLITSQADLLSGFLRFNGDDFIGLQHMDTLVDRIGQLEEDPGGSWDVAGTNAATADQVLVRKEVVQRGTDNWTQAAGISAWDSEWLVFEAANYDNIGKHDFSKPNPRIISTTDQPIQLSCDGKKTVLFPNVKAVNKHQLEYEWYIEQGGGSFSLIKNQDGFSLLDNGSLLIDDASALPLTQLYCRLSDPYRGCEVNTAAILADLEMYSGAAGQWGGYVSNEWSDCLNWADGKVPDSTTSVTVGAEQEIMLQEGEQFVCHDLQLEESQLIFEPDSELRLSGDLRIDYGGSMVAEARSNYVVFEGDTQQINLEEESLHEHIGLEIENGTYVQLEQRNLYLPYASNTLRVKNRGALDLEEKSLRGDGQLIMEDSAHLLTASREGLANIGWGALRLNGSVELSAQGKFTFYDQVENTGNMLPDTVRGLFFESLQDTAIQLSRSVTVTDSLWLQQAYLYTSENSISLENGSIFKEDSFSCIKGVVHSSAVIDVSTNYQAEFGNVGVEIDASVNKQDLGTVTLSRYNGSDRAVVVGQEEGINRRWTIEVEQEPQAYVELTFNWSEDETKQQDMSRGQLWKRSGEGDWQRVGEMSDMSQGEITARVRSFSDWTVSAFDVELPVELLKLEGYASEGKVNLFWQTVSEQQNEGFELQRSVDGEIFTSVGFIPGAGTSYQLQSYRYTEAWHRFPIYYRLKQMDMDGAFHYSHIIEIDQAEHLTFQLSVFPNPTRGPVQLKGDAEKLSLEMMSSEGHQLLVTEGSLIDLEQKINVNLKNKPTGMYLLKFRDTESAEHFVVNLIKYE